MKLVNFTVFIAFILVNVVIAQSNFGAWTVYSNTDGSNFLASSDINNFSNDLYVRCGKANLNEVEIFVVNEKIMLSASEDTLKGSFGFDDGELTSTEFYPSTTLKGFFLGSSDISMFFKMANYSARFFVFARTQYRGGSAYGFAFDMSGLIRAARNLPCAGRYLS